MRHRVVITGVGAITPLGVGARTLADRWADGHSGIVDGLGRCAEFDPTDTMSRKEAHRSDRFTQMALAAAGEALHEAGWDRELPYPSERVGCVLGTGIGGIGTIEDQCRVLSERGRRGMSPFGVPMLMGNAVAAAIAMRHGLRGPNWAVSSACAAGAHAIGTAFELVRGGQAEAVVTGGSEAALTGVAISLFERMGATSRVGISRPFDARRDGFVLGEGAAVLVLEQAEAARARGAKALAELRGYGATSDAFHLTAPEPSGAGAERAISVALEDASVRPDEIDYVNAHGTGTPLNDRIETRALKASLGRRAWEIPVSSLKSAIGHLCGAGGAVEAVATVLALRRRIAPPTLNWEQPEEGLDLDFVPGVARPLAEPAEPRPLVALSNSFGFGGHNAVLCLAEAAP